MSGSSQKTSSRQFQAPKGTRDFYPADLALRRHIENIWRQTSINHGFDEIDGPTFEHLDLYTHKSGPAIASELFQVFSGKDPEQAAAIRAGGAAPLALRPEFTPTLARMVAARAPELPRPIKWFAMPSHFRAESPQRGRLREFMQWNVDFIGDDSPRADAEVIATAVGALAGLGLASSDITVRICHRQLLVDTLRASGVSENDTGEALSLLDKRDRMDRAAFVAESAALGLDTARFEASIASACDVINGAIAKCEQGAAAGDVGTPGTLESLSRLIGSLQECGVLKWCEFDASIVRGLAYYTGTVFEIHEASGAERAIAGGGRYDKLIEGFGGPALPACGFGMGDVVLANILRDKGLLKPAEEYLPRPDAFVIAASDDAAARLPALVSQLRRGGLHVRQSYKATRNVGKLLGDAGKCRARYAVILGAELAESPPRVALKDLDSGAQDTLALDELANRLRRMDAQGGFMNL